MKLPQDEGRRGVNSYLSHPKGFCSVKKARFWDVPRKAWTHKISCLKSVEAAPKGLVSVKGRAGLLLTVRRSTESEAI